MKRIDKTKRGKNWYWFKCLKDDGSEFDFTAKFANAFRADRWAMKCFHLWMIGKVNYRIIFYC